MSNTGLVHGEQYRPRTRLAIQASHTGKQGGWCKAVMQRCYFETRSYLTVSRTSHGGIHPILWMRERGRGGRAGIHPRVWMRGGGTSRDTSKSVDEGEGGRMIIDTSKSVDEIGEGGGGGRAGTHPRVWMRVRVRGHYTTQS